MTRGEDGTRGPNPTAPAGPRPAEARGERLQKILARAGVASRRHVEALITEGRVTVNGRPAELGERADISRDAIKVDGKRILAPTGSRHYLLFNKPKGVMTTLSDPEGRRTVLDFVPPKFRRALVPVGRLDFHTEGLLLLTDDGEFAERLSHPRYGCKKTYLAKVSGTPVERDLDRLREGIVIEGQRTAPSRITAARPPGEREGENTWWTVELFEGRTRQIREMFSRIGHPVQKLRRIAIGPLSDPQLPVGGLRELTEDEVLRLRRATARVHSRAETRLAVRKPSPRPPLPPPRGVRPQAGARADARPRADARRRPEAGSRPAARPAGRPGAPQRPDARPRPESRQRPDARPRPESRQPTDARPRREARSRPDAGGRPESRPRPNARPRGVEPAPSRNTSAPRDSADRRRPPGRRDAPSPTSRPKRSPPRPGHRTR